jgi:hypothetical protein
VVLMGVRWISAELRSDIKERWIVWKRIVGRSVPALDVK